MKWVRDRTRRFEWRPYYAQDEIDVHCEDAVRRFFSDSDRPVSYPLSTDDLTVLIERSVAELDLYANLASEGRDVEGVTEFHSKAKPSVRIAKYLSEQPARQNRLRSTLAHEYGHVAFHGFLWSMEPWTAPSRSKRSKAMAPRCRRARIVAAPQTDWIEWQAGYASGALLMPATVVGDIVTDAFAEWGVARWVQAGSDRHSDLVGRIAAKFAVSKDAAAMRVLKLGYTTA